jgi:hypothetical protein
LPTFSFFGALLLLLLLLLLSRGILMDVSSISAAAIVKNHSMECKKKPNGDGF